MAVKWSFPSERFCSWQEVRRKTYRMCRRKVSRIREKFGRVSGLVDYRRFVKTFGNVNADNVHIQHPFRLTTIVAAQNLFADKETWQYPAHY